MNSRASSSSHPWKYDVFLSFCGLDTRTNFTDHLFNELIRDGIHTFRDNENLNRGEDISSELMAAIENSRIAIIVFSPNYASSSWCLSELLKILDCKRDGRTEKVLPVFYKVDPSDVRKQSNAYAEAFRRHEERFKHEIGKVETWRAALTEAANLSGWDQVNFADGHEAELIKRIVEEVLTIVNRTCLHVAVHVVGVNSHIENIVSLLNDGGLGVVRMVGIHGPGGIGKTTIAKAVFNMVFKNFEGSCLLANVRELSSQPNGLAQLQKQLLSDIFKREAVGRDNEDQGIIVIQERLCYKRVLIVLDDVEETDQFYNLVGGHDSLGLGSQVILTTRDEHLLSRLDVDEKYKYRVETMNQNDSLQLFSRHAFKQNHPLDDYLQLSNDVINYAGGLPLALVTLGSLLYRRSQIEWERELKKLQKIPNNRIFEKLEISYNALDEFDQAIFLDISCFFIGKDKNFVIEILDACDLGGEAGIKLLVERSLVTIDKDNKLWMHDLIRDMGREIVRKQSPLKPGGRSRLWDNKDAIDVLKNLTGTDAVEGLQCDFHEPGQLTIEGFSKMPNLRLLKIRSKYNTFGLDSIPESICCFKNLVWVSWEYFPGFPLFGCIPDNFRMDNLVILRMPCGMFREVWKGTRYLPKLKELDLSDNEMLTHMPDFSGLRNLEKLNFNVCLRLVEVHESIACLKKLVTLDLWFCVNLSNLPNCISWCSKLENLQIGECRGLESLPVLPSSLCALDASCCYKLKRLPNLSNLKHLKILNLSNCGKLSEIQGFEGLKSVATVNLKGCVNLGSFVKKRIFQDVSEELVGNRNACEIILDEIQAPEWFGFQSGSEPLENPDELSIQVPIHELQPQHQGLIIHVLLDYIPVRYATQPNLAAVVLKIKNYTWRHQIQLKYGAATTWVITVPYCVWRSTAEDGEGGNIIDFSVKKKSGKFLLDKIGFHWIHTSRHEMQNLEDTSR